MKTCITCKEVKNFDCFSVERGKHRGSCKDCRRDQKRARAHIYNENARKKNAENPEIAKAYKKKHRAKPGVKEAESLYKKEYNSKNIERTRETKKAWTERNRVRIKEQTSRKYHENKQKALEINKAWMAKNAEYRKEYSKKYRESNKAQRAASQKIRQCRKLKATPAWSEVEAIKKLYIEASKIGGMHVDHIVPLKSKMVCGLHVLANLQIIPGKENIAKSNKWWPDMPNYEVEQDAQ